MHRFVTWLIVAAILLAPLGALAARTMQVGVKNAPLRATAAPFGKVVATLHYGDKVEIQEESAAWIKVKSSAGSGWVHRTMLAAKVAALKAGTGDLQSAASKDELTLAGKGFNAQVEAEYRKQNQQLDFATIDRMAAGRPDPERMARFMTEGGLIPAGGDDAR